MNRIFMNSETVRPLTCITWYLISQIKYIYQKVINVCIFKCWHLLNIEEYKKVVRKQ